jgi:hypothetical protein
MVDVLQGLVQKSCIFGFRVSVVFADFSQRFVDDRVAELSSGLLGLREGSQCL